MKTGYLLHLILPVTFVAQTHEDCSHRLTKTKHSNRIHNNPMILKFLNGL